MLPKHCQAEIKQSKSCESLSSSTCHNKRRNFTALNLKINKFSLYIKTLVVFGPNKTMWDRTRTVKYDHKVTKRLY